MQSGANVLVIDEPTNHLDLESREALEDALRAFEGSVLLVSHDRALLDAVGTRTIAIEDGGLRSYEGGWADYLYAREQREAAEKAASEPAPAPKAPKRASAQAAGPSKNARRAQEQLERDIEVAEAALASLEDELADPSAWAEPGRAAQSAERHEAAKAQLAQLYEKWEKTPPISRDFRPHAGHAPETGP